MCIVIQQQDYRAKFEEQQTYSYSGTITNQEIVSVTQAQKTISDVSIFLICITNTRLDQVWRVDIKHDKIKKVIQFELKFQKAT